ncbi:hypothetical protein ABIB30_000108 [Pedobacter sp. UYP1]
MIKFSWGFFKGKLNIEFFYKSPAVSLLSRLKKTKRRVVF